MGHTSNLVANPAFSSGLTNWNTTAIGASGTMLAAVPALYELKDGKPALLNFQVRQGTYVADVLYFTGERPPDVAQFAMPVLPAGYNYDLAHAGKGPSHGWAFFTSYSQATGTWWAVSSELPRIMAAPRRSYSLPSRPR